jgi:hypothetical protein
MKAKTTLFMVLVIFLFSPFAYGDYGDWDGPYSEDEWIHGGNRLDPENYPPMDPRIMGWATEVMDYWRPEGINFGTPDLVLGQPGGTFDVFSLGDGGWITVSFDQAISNGPGPDLAVWENGFINVSVPPLGMLFGELMFVEVSTDGVNFARFPSVCLNPTTEPIGAFGCIDPTYYHYVGGKHPNGNDARDEGTAFDLEDLQDDPLVIEGTVDLNNILYVKLIDVIGDGSTFDSLGNPMWDPYPTQFGSGGADADAVCLLKDVYVLHLGIDGEGGDFFPQELAEEAYYTGPAAAKQTLRWIYGDPYDIYTESQANLYNTYHNGTPGQDMNTADVRTLIQDEKPTTTPSYAYNFSAKADDEEDMAIKRFIHWCDFNVQSYYPSGTGINEPQVPSLIVSNEDTYGYVWKTLRGFVTDVDPCDDDNVFTIPDMTVYGLWLNDPAIGGLGYNVYLTGDEFKDMYEQVDGKYRSVVEPPEGIDVIKVEANLRKARVSYVKGRQNKMLANVFKDLRVKRTSSFVSMSITDRNEHLRLFEAIRWDRVIPNELLRSPDFKNVFSKTRFNGVLKVTDLNTNADYRLVLFSQSGKENSASVVLAMDGEDGKFRKATWVGEDQSYLPISRKEALEIAAKALRTTGDLKKWEIRLVWDKEANDSNFFPMYEITVRGVAVVYVYQDGSFDVEKAPVVYVKPVPVRPSL